MGDWCAQYHALSLLWSVLGFVLGYIVGTVHKGRRP